MSLANLLEYFISLEGLATVFAIIYLILAIKQNVWCWFFGIISTSIFLYVVFNANLYMESALQVFYLVISFYGIWKWKFSEKNDAQEKELAVSRLTPKEHVVAIFTIVGLSVLSSLLLAQYTDAAMPFIDSLTSWGGVVATFMVARKVFENWHYWFVIDSISIYLFYSRELYLFALLFVVYLVLIVIGYNTWKKSLPTTDA